jgi:uncharacterized protein
MLVCSWRASVALLFAAIAFAYDFGALKPEGYLNDFTGVVDYASRQEIERYSKQVQDSTGVQMAFVILPSLQGEPVEDVANTIFRKWGIGEKGKNEGLLFLLSLGDQRSRLEVGYGLEPILPDGFAGELLRSIRPQLQAKQYGPALLEAAHVIGERVARAKNTTIQDSPRRPVRVRQPVDLAWEWLFPGAFILFILWMNARQRRTRRAYSSPGVLPYFGGWGSGWGGSSSGGFGGYDSSDSFGGFGGGDSGGGGASSDW